MRWWKGTLSSYSGTREHWPDCDAAYCSELPSSSGTRWQPDLVEEALVVQGLSLGPDIGLAQSNLLTDVTLPIACELGLLVPVRILGLKPPLTLPLSSSLFPAKTSLMVVTRRCEAHAS